MFQRLVAIPQEEYMQLKTVQQARQPLTQQFYNMQKQYSEGEHITEPYKRLVHQAKALDEMKELKEKMRQDIVASTPKPYRTRAKVLFQSLEPFVRFNERGEIYGDDNQLIGHSRLEDLVQHAVRDRRRNIKPEGWTEFLRLLQKHNVPRFTLNRDTLDEIKVDDIKEYEAKEDVPLSRKRKQVWKDTVAKGMKRKRIKLENISPENKPKRIMQRPQRRRKESTKYGPESGFLQNYN